MNTKEFAQVYFDCSDFDTDAIVESIEKAEEIQKMGVFIVGMERNSVLFERMARALMNIPSIVYNDVANFEKELRQLKSLELMRLD